MSWWQALLLGLIQGLTEFLPVSSSGHLELGKSLFDVQLEDNLIFTVIVHFATVLATIVVFRAEIGRLFVGFFSKGQNEDKTFVLKLLLSMIPVGIVGVFFKDEVESLFGGKILFVGIMLLVTALLLTISYYKPKGNRDIGWLDAFVIGVGQAFAVLPGLSRSGTTIATGMIIGNKHDNLAKFSFLMVIIPILGELFLDVVSGNIAESVAGIGIVPIVTGFVAAFLSGLLACKWMINIVRRGKLIYFAVYCLIIGLVAIAAGII